jgi:hypothetical protein
MRTSAILWLAALAAGISTPAPAQPVASPHQHGQPAATGQSPQAGQHQGSPGADGRCDCCEMMKQMMQMMRTMHQHSGERGMKMDMMQSPGSPPQGSAPAGAEHQHEDKPRG